MTMQVSHVAEGAGWRAGRFVCTAGPGDRPFEEQHDCYSISLVTRGSFEYRSDLGQRSLVPGALLLGNFGQCYRCGHDHGSGDECISFHFTPDLWEEIVAATPGARQLAFSRAAHPPDWKLAPLLARLETAVAPEILEEIAFDLAGAVLAATDAGSGAPVRDLTRRDRVRIVEAVLTIEAEAEEGEAAPVSLAALARGAGMSRFHFLRLFRRVVGMTPHQFLLRLRMQRAATRLRQSRASVSQIAFQAGFGDLSTFNRQFKRIFGANPRAFRGGDGASPARDSA